MLAFSGHRPEKLGGYSHEADQRLRAFARQLLPPLLSMTSQHCAISGMALGWDQSVAHACIDLGIPFVAAVPFPQQPDRWPEASRRRWHALCDKARAVHTLYESYSVERLQLRNEWMVDNGVGLAALWDSTPGGTANCVRYARHRSKPVINVWPHWRAFVLGERLPPLPSLDDFTQPRVSASPQGTLFCGIS